jgi:uncharacterized protein (TIGR00645 family)
MMRIIPRFLASLLYASRWLLAPIYVGLSLTLPIVAIKFMQELWHMFVELPHLDEAAVILMTLTLIDLALIGSLLVMVILAGYENFISSFDQDLGTNLSWIGKLDAGGLKVKVASAIVAISAINLLKEFMNILEVPNDKLLWYMLIHITFIFSALAMGFLSKITKEGH